MSNRLSAIEQTLAKSLFLLIPGISENEKARKPLKNSGFRAKKRQWRTAAELLWRDSNYGL